jgi:amidase
VVLKDNIDTRDLPTTACSFVLAGSHPPDDASLVKKFREAGAVILAKLNMSEFAAGSAMSSLGGASLNPHAVDRSPRSSGAPASLAAARSSESGPIPADRSAGPRRRTGSSDSSPPMVS